VTQQAAPALAILATVSSIGSVMAIVCALWDVRSLLCTNRCSKNFAVARRAHILVEISLYCYNVVSTGGPSCADQRCSGTFAWFGDINADHSTAADDGAVDCSGVGTCDTTTGTCS
jgi:hypothetical protein